MVVPGFFKFFFKEWLFRPRLTKIYDIIEEDFERGGVMKMIQKIIALLIAIIALITYLTQTYLEVDIWTLFTPDNEEPVIDSSELPSTVSVNGTVDFTVITCSDNRDTSCSVTIEGTIDTTTLGEQTITATAEDKAGNSASVTITIEVIDGIDTTVYVPLGYYDGIDGLTGDALKSALNDIITNHTEYPYTSSSTDVWDILRDADEDPDNPDNIITFYSGFSWPKDCQDTTTPPDFCYQDETQVEWNREHIWSKSRGDFEHEDGSSTQAKGAHTDAHHIVAAERRMNSIKNNRHFEDCNDGDDTNIEDRGYGNYTCNDWEFEPRDEVKGDVARMLFYMAVRYEGEDGDYVDLELENEPNSDRDLKDPIYGDLDDLLRWHIEDPVSEWEIERNETIYSYQGNRNPFIDHPELVELIWGSAEDYTYEYIPDTNAILPTVFVDIVARNKEY
jgi:endonuclease I